MPREPIHSKYLHQKAKRLGFAVAGTFELTPRCNFNCKMCYVHLTEQEQRRRGRELTAAQWLSLGKQACAQGMVFLLLTGGEPLLRPDFPEIYRGLHEMGLILSINTNGYLLRGELLELFKELPPSRVNISLYGTSDETYRRLCGVPAYDTILENIRALRVAGIEVRITMSVTEYNRADMEKVYAQAKALGAHTLANAYMFPPTRVTGQFGGGDRLSAQEAADAEVTYQRLSLGAEGFCEYARNMENGIINRAEGDCESLPSDKMTCRAGRSSFWLSWDGTMTPCGMMPMPACSASENGFDVAWQSIRTAVEDIRLPEKCTVCPQRKLCHVCAAMCYCETGAFDRVPEYVCGLTRRRYEQTLSIWKNELGGK